MEEYRTLRELMLLYEEGAVENDSGPALVDSRDTEPSESVPDSQPQSQPMISKKFKPKSRNFPDLMTSGTLNASSGRMFLPILPLIKYKHLGSYKNKQT